LRKSIFDSVIVLLLFMIGCSGTETDKPPIMLKGQDPCDNCFMIINETKYSASLKLENGEAKRFDDIGCMLNYLNKNKDHVKKYWVYNYANSEPLNANEAFFIHSTKIITPMGYGIIAFDSRLEASKYADNNKTEILTFKDLSNKYHQSNMEHN